MKGCFLTSGYANPAEEGLRCWDYDTQAGSILQRWGLRGLNSPTYLLRHPNGQVLYSGEKGSGPDYDGFLVTYALEEDGARVLKRLHTGGASPCHLSLDEQKTFLFVSNYASGTMSVFRLDEDGMPTQRCCLVQHEGHGVHPERQDGPHVHYAMCRGDLVYVCDLGLDKVFCYHLDRETGTLRLSGQSYITAPGDGPRHLAFHPTLPGCFSLLTELTGKVYVLRQTDSGLESIQVRSALPEDFRGENTAAAIRYTDDGACLLTSNRGHDSIAVFRVQSDGTLSEAVFCSSGGSGPRDFHLAGNLVLSSNQYSGELAVLELDPEDCSLRPLAHTGGGGKPTCVLPL